MSLGKPTMPRSDGARQHAEGNAAQLVNIRDVRDEKGRRRPGWRRFADFLNPEPIAYHASLPYQHDARNLVFWPFPQANVADHDISMPSHRGAEWHSCLHQSRGGRGCVDDVNMVGARRLTAHMAAAKLIRPLVTIFIGQDGVLAKGWRAPRLARRPHSQDPDLFNRRKRQRICKSFAFVPTFPVPPQLWRCAGLAS